MELNFESPHWVSGMADWAGIIDEIRRGPDRATATLNRFHITPSYLQTLVAPLPTTNEPYSRKVLYSGKIGEVMLAHWKENAICSPHDHGQSRGIVWLASGEFEETSYRFDQGLLQTGTSQKFSAGTALKVEPGDIHAMRVFGIGMSLHIYTPPITGMKVYDAQSRTTLTVTDNCGAWIPSSENYVVGREPWT